MSLINYFVKLSTFCLLLSPSLGIAEQICKANNIVATTNHLVDSRQGIISDLVTGLEWKRCSEGQAFGGTENNTCTGTVMEFTWQTALQRSAAVNTGTATGVENLGRNDWRLPTIKELNSIVELSCSEPNVNLAAFPDVGTNGGYFSSSQSASDGSMVLVVNFEVGFDAVFSKTFAGPAVRLVRDAG